MTNNKPWDPVRIILENIAKLTFLCGEPKPLNELAKPDMPVTAFIEYSGPVRGNLRLAASYAVAEELTKAMLGLLPDEDVSEQAVFDAFGETANVLCSHILPEEYNVVFHSPQVNRSEASSWDELWPGESPVAVDLEGEPFVVWYTPVAQEES